MKQKRLLSLDVMRGITIAGMIMVNNPGSWGNIYEPLEHASWHGLTPTDLVFPFFMFIMGISMYFSLKKYDYKMSKESITKIFRRTILILLIGWAIAWLGLFLRRATSPDYSWFEAVFNFDQIRTLGVFPRLAICYGVSALLVVLLNRKWLMRVTVGMLLAYLVILLCGNGFEFSDENVISIVDKKVLGVDHMYSDTVDGVTLKFDPEGLLSTLPSIAHCLIGFFCGMLILKNKNNEDRAFNLFIVGAILTMAGFLFSYGCPINKKIWSPTFVLTTCGLASTLQALLIWIIDIKGWKKWGKFFEIFGVNPLYLYVQSTLFAYAFGFIRIASAAAEKGYVPLKIWIYNECLVPMCGENMKLASLVFALLFVLLNWSIGVILYKKKIYIKI